MSKETSVVELQDVFFTYEIARTETVAGATCSCGHLVTLSSLNRFPQLFIGPWNLKGRAREEWHVHEEADDEEVKKVLRALLGEALVMF